ncbi:MAG: hypothetical protein IJ158_05040 [Treponema sp.]|nr:hypothetical protein [Treponema sp.]
MPVALHKALIRAWDEIIKNPDRWYVAVSGQSIAQCPEFGPQLFNVDGGKFQNYSPEITEDLIKKLQSLYDFFKKIGRLPVQKDVHGLADNSY